MSGNCRGSHILSISVKVCEFSFPWYRFLQYRKYKLLIENIEFTIVANKTQHALNGFHLIHSLIHKDVIFLKKTLFSNHFCFDEQPNIRILRDIGLVSETSYSAKTTFSGGTDKLFTVYV